MEERTTRKLHIEAIRTDLNQILNEWLHLHYRISIILVVIALFVEIGMAFFIAQSEILTTSISRYILKFIIAPSGVAALCLLVSSIMIHREKTSYQTKIYVISLMFVVECFIYCTAHSAFIAIYALYAVAIFLTTTYADYKLTSLVSTLSIVSLSVSELFLKWDLDKIGALDSANQLVQYLVAIFVLIGCSLASAVTIHYERRKNEASLKREVERELMKESLLYDELTGTLNRKALHEELKALEKTPPTTPLVFGIADIDHFKSVNDLYGHHVGDLCLMEFSCILCEYFGDSSVYRYGGDEFCLVLRNTTLSTAEQLCERVQNRLRRVEFEGVPELKPTASFGLTAFSTQEGSSRLFNQADEALYDAKIVRNEIRAFRRVPVFSDSKFRISLNEDLSGEA